MLPTGVSKALPVTTLNEKKSFLVLKEDVESRSFAVWHIDNECGTRTL